jgi:hypothetical protein
MSTYSGTIPSRAAIEVRTQQIAAFLRRQANLTHLLHVQDGDREIVTQLLPDAVTAVKVYRDALRGQQKSIASNRGRTQMSAAPARLARLSTQVRACIRGLRNSGAEFVLCWQIAGRSPELVFHAGARQHDPVREVIAALERARRQGDGVGLVLDEMVVSRW